MIGICGNLIQKKLVNAVNNSECFAILGDETLDISGQEQFSLCVRYIQVTDSKHILKEDFVCFLPVHDMSSEALAKSILETCQTLGFNMDKLVGQGYDGAANMSGHISGVQTRIQTALPKAIYVHCASHRLNLVLSDSLSITFVKIVSVLLKKFPIFLERILRQVTC